jgi:hypothetical protein
MAREGFDAAEAHRVARDLQPPQELERARLAALDLEREQRAGKIALRIADALLLRARVKTAVSGLTR